MNFELRYVLRAASLLLVSLTAGHASAFPAFSGLYVFGDSLVDGGDARLLLDTTSMPPANTPTPIPGDAFIPLAPYERGAGLLPAFSDGENLAERLAASLGLATPTAFLAGGNNAAVGGARMAGGAGVPGVPEQVNRFIARLDAMSTPPGLADAPADGLYLIAAGSNDVRDAAAGLSALQLAGADADAIDAALEQALTDYAFALAGAVGDLVLEGARNFVILNVPDAGLTPAVRALGAVAQAQASALTAAFNQRYRGVMDFLDDQFLATGFADVDLVRFDFAGLLQAATSDAQAFGFDNVTEACAADPACLADPGGYLYWDGIHPARLGHTVAADAIALALQAASVPAPATLFLLITALTAVRARRRPGRCIPAVRERGRS